MLEVTSTLPITIYAWWDNVPASLKTLEQLKRKGLLPTGTIRARVVYGQGRRARSHDLYDEQETRVISRREPTAKQRAEKELRQAVKSERQRTCCSCRQVISCYSLINKEGLCPDCE